MSIFDAATDVASQTVQVERARAVLAEVVDYFVAKDNHAYLRHYAEHIETLLLTADALLANVVPSLEKTSDDLTVIHKANKDVKPQQQPGRSPPTLTKAKVDFCEFDDMVFKAEQLANMVGALHTAMFESGSSAENFDYAMYLFESLIHDHAKELKALFESARKAKGSNGATVRREGAR